MKVHPDKKLDAIRQAIADYQAHGDATLALNDVIENFTELDRWLSDANFLPLAWRNAF
jgi:hypothetical protein